MSGCPPACHNDNGMVKEFAGLAAPARHGSAPDTAWAFFEGEYVPVRDAKVSVMTHAFNYGTGVFEGVRAYWNPVHEQLYGLHLKEHFQRLHQSCRIMRLDLAYSVDELVEITCEVLRRSGFREDAYVRPLAYKSDEIIGVRLHDLTTSFTLFAVPFGNYVEIDRGLSVCVSSWRRVDDNAIPARCKITGSYVNAALAKTEAQEAGFDEAIVLTHDGHVSEGSAANLYMVRGGVLITPPATDNILEGIVRASVMRLAKDEGIPVEIRSIDRTELYLAEELFLCGTGVQMSSITSVDRRKIGDGEIGPIARQLGAIYFEAVRGNVDRYKEWVTPIYR